MDNKYIIIGRSSCPFCIRAVDYCSAMAVECIFLDYADHTGILEEYKEFHGQSTVPIILSNNLESGRVERVGGYTDLLEYLT